MTDRDDDRARPDLGRQPNLAAVAEALSSAIGGATRMTRARAKETAEKLLTQAGFDQVDLGRVDLGRVDLSGAAADATTRINQLADEIMAARRANRDQLQRAVAGELDKSLARLGLARSEDVDALRSEIAELRAEVTAVRKQRAAESSSAQTTDRSAAKKASSASATKSSTAKKSTAKKAATKSTATKSTAKKTPAKKSTTKRSTTGTAKSTAKKTTKKS